MSQVLLERPLAEFAARESRPDIAYSIGTTAAAGEVSTAAESQEKNLGEMMDRMLEPGLLEAEKKRLLSQEADPEYEGRYVSGWRYGYMEARPGSLMMGSTDERAQDIAEAVSRSRHLGAPGQNFARKETVDEILRAADEDHAIVIESIGTDPVLELPLNNFVYGQNLESWEGRSAAYDKEEERVGTKRTSQLTIEEYAARTTKAPPLESVAGFVQPDGTVIFMTEQGSHRTAAAIKRGDTKIQVRKLTLHRLKSNFYGDQNS